MIGPRKLITITSLAVLLGFGIAAIQNYTVSADSLIDNSSEILDFGEKTNISTLSHTSGHK